MEIPANSLYKSLDVPELPIPKAKTGGRIDIFDLSSIVEGMKEESVEGYYVPDDQALKELKILWEEVSK